MRNVVMVLAMVACGVLVAGAGRPVENPSSPVQAPAKPVAVDNATGDQAGKVVPAFPRGPAMTAVPAGEVDGLILFDVFVSGVVDLRGYQVTLEAIGMKGDLLDLQDIWVDTVRPDYVFASQQVVTAVDLVGGRLAGAMFLGSVDAMRPAYVGTFAFNSPPEASGTFNAQVLLGKQSLLRTAASTPIAFKAGPAAVVAVEKVSNRPRPR